MQNYENWLALDLEDLSMNKSLTPLNIINEPLEHCRPLIITYVDFKKVLDSIYDHILRKTLKMYSISQGCIDIFQKLYPNSCCCVKTGSGNILYINAETAVQQGDITSPFFLSCSNGLFDEKCNDSTTLWNHLVEKGID